MMSSDFDASNITPLFSELQREFEALDARDDRSLLDWLDRLFRQATACNVIIPFADTILTMLQEVRGLDSEKYPIAHHAIGEDVVRHLLIRCYATLLHPSADGYEYCARAIRIWCALHQ